MMSAVSLAVAPTVSLRSSSWTRPSTEPSIRRSSLPEISPLMCKLGPSRAVERSAVAPIGRIASVLIGLFPSQDVAAGVEGGGLTGKFFGCSGCAACGVSGFLFPHIGPPKGQHTPRRFPARGKQKIVRWETCDKHNIVLACLKVTRPKNRWGPCTSGGERRAKARAPVVDADVGNAHESLALSIASVTPTARVWAGT